MSQPSLFAVHDLIRAPHCLYIQHCGAKAELGPMVWDGADCINQSSRCVRCGKPGVGSINLALRSQGERDALIRKATT